MDTTRTMRKWTPEERGAIGRLWQEGKTAGQISREFDCSRNSIIGIVTRLGLTRFNKFSGNDVVRRMRAKREAKARAVRAAKPRKLSRKPPSQFNFRRPTLDELMASAADWRAIKAEIERQDADRTDLVALLDLEEHQCRWPIGEPTRGFCGHTKVPGKSNYCAGHLARSVTSIDKLSYVSAMTQAFGAALLDTEKNLSELTETVAA